MFYNDEGQWMSKRGEAMTEDEAVERYRCDECNSDGNCSHDCVLSATGSVRCQSCDGRVYFANSRYPEAPYDCVYCDAHNKDYSVKEGSYNLTDLQQGRRVKDMQDDIRIKGER